MYVHSMMGKTEEEDVIRSEVEESLPVLKIRHLIGICEELDLDIMDEAMKGTLSVKKSA